MLVTSLSCFLSVLILGKVLEADDGLAFDIKTEADKAGFVMTAMLSGFVCGGFVVTVEKIVNLVFLALGI